MIYYMIYMIIFDIKKIHLKLYNYRLHFVLQVSGNIGSCFVEN